MTGSESSTTTQRLWEQSTSHCLFRLMVGTAALREKCSHVLKFSAFAVARSAAIYPMPFVLGSGSFMLRVFSSTSYRCVAILGDRVEFYILLLSGEPRSDGTNAARVTSTCGVPPTSI